MLAELVHTFDSTAKLLWWAGAALVPPYTACYSSDGPAICSPRCWRA